MIRLFLPFSVTSLRAFVVLCGAVIGGLAACGDLSAADPFAIHSFERQQLTGEYFSEGAAGGDLNNDGHGDVVYGPHWYEGPSFEKKHEIYAPKPQNREGYADHFFAWIYDFDGDGWKDVFTVGFPGTPAFVYQNPGRDGGEKHWTKHQVFDWVSNESPQLTNLVGDARPELVCTRDGFFGFATIDWNKPFEPWTFHPISEQVADKRFGHGLGVGDVNGDGRLDVLHSKGWFAQPEQDALTSRWGAHAAPFTGAYGGAEMYAYDVDGDGDNDVITSLAAHDFGLSWFEQTRQDGRIEFKEHRILGTHPADNRYGVLFTELHSVALADIDGDGLKDIVTGKTYYSHHKGSPLWDAGAVVYWFQLVRGPDGVDWVPHRADGEAGIGRQVTLVDLQGDGLLDIVVGGMKGAHVLKHRKQEVDRATWEQSRPKLYQGPPKPSTEGATSLRGKRLSPEETTGKVPGAIEAESLKPRVSAGTTHVQAMASFKKDRWSGDAQLFWGGARPGDSLELELPAASGATELELVLTCARDFAVVQLSLDGRPLGKPVDLFEPDVVTTGVLAFSVPDVPAGSRKLTIQVLGANPKAAPAFVVGIDYVRWKKARE